MMHKKGVYVLVFVILVSLCAGLLSLAVNDGPTDSLFNYPGPRYVINSEIYQTDNQGYSDNNTVISIQSPVNASIYSRTNISLAYTISGLNLDKCWYQNYSGTENISLPNCGNTTFVAKNGFWNLTIYANDTAGNINSSIVFFTVNTTPILVVSMPINGTVYGSYNLTLDYVASDLNLDSCWYQNTTGQNLTLPNCQNTSYTVSGDGYYNITVYANNSLNNVNSSQIFFSVDVGTVTVSIQSPRNLTYYNSSNISLQFTPNALQASCYCQNITDQNLSLTCGGLSSFVASDGFHNITVYVNNSDGKTNSSTVFFGVDTVYPGLVVQSPINRTYYQATNISLNFTTLDLNRDKCWYQNYTGTENIPLPTCQNTTFNVTTGDGFYNITVYVNDTAGNTNSSAVFLYIDTTAPNVSQTCTPSSVGIGGLVTCNCSATDNLNSSPVVNYTQLPITSSYGTFVTNCTAEDTAGNIGIDSDSYTVASSSDTGLSSGGGGGGGGVTAAGNETILIKQWNNIGSDSTVTFDINKTKISFTRITMETKKNVSSVEMKIIGSVPISTAPYFGGTVYQFLEVKTKNLTGIRKATIEFKIEKRWLALRNFKEEDIALFRRALELWNELPTSIIDKNDKYIYYSAESPGFSYFAITVKLKLATTAGHRHSGILANARVARFRRRNTITLFDASQSLSRRTSAF